MPPVMMVMPMSVLARWTVGVGIKHAHSVVLVQGKLALRQTLPPKVGGPEPARRDYVEVRDMASGGGRLLQAGAGGNHFLGVLPAGDQVGCVGLAASTGYRKKTKKVI